MPELDVTKAETASSIMHGPEVSDDAYDAADLARLDEVDPSPAGEPAALEPTFSPRLGRQVGLSRGMTRRR